MVAHFVTTPDILSCHMELALAVKFTQSCCHLTSQVPSASSVIVQTCRMLRNQVFQCLSAFRRSVDLTCGTWHAFWDPASRTVNKGLFSRHVWEICFNIQGAIFQKRILLWNAWPLTTGQVIALLLLSWMVTTACLRQMPEAAVSSLVNRLVTVSKVCLEHSLNIKLHPCLHEGF